MSKDQTAAKGASISNEEAYARYRRTVESDLRHRVPLIDTGTEWSLHTQIVARWLGRYSRRRDVVEGVPGYGQPLVDTPAFKALVARNLARDAEWTVVPAWDEMTLYATRMTLQHTHDSIEDFLGLGNSEDEGSGTVSRARASQPYSGPPGALKSIKRAASRH